MKTNKRNYKIIPYDPQWPILFSEESERINRIVGSNILEIHHIGSTSVFGMPGKATIDILFVVDDISRIDDHISHLKKVGYASLGSRNAENSHLFEKNVDGNRVFIIHFYPKNHPEIFQIIAIRDYLKTHTDKANQYGEFKFYLFQKFPNDYSQYRKLKDAYMDDLKREAENWFKLEKIILEK